jgi:pimeloyl-ACP methyl ester carboxylesterase
MGRSGKIAVGIVVALAALLAVNALVTGAETKDAEVTVPGGRLVEMPGGTLQLVEYGRPDATPIVLIHCFTCSTNWWDRMVPLLERQHRVIAVDLLGHGGSEKPESGYSMENQADLVAQVLGRLGVRDATVVGHSLGGGVATALAERSPALVDRVVIIDSRSSPHDSGDLGLLAKLVFTPVIGEALWRVKADFSVRDGLEVAFAPGFDVPDVFVDDVKRMTYSAYDDSAGDDYSEERSLGARLAASGKPVMVIMGAEEQIIDDPRAALASYARAVPAARTVLMPGAGHSPNVEAPERTASLVLGFAAGKSPAKPGKEKIDVQERMQKRDAVRSQP